MGAIDLDATTSELSPDWRWVLCLKGIGMITIGVVCLLAGLALDGPDGQWLGVTVGVAGCLLWLRGCYLVLRYG